MLDCMTRFMNSGKNERSRETHCKSARCSCEIDAAIDDEIETPLARNCVSASKHNPRALLMNEDALGKRGNGEATCGGVSGRWGASGRNARRWNEAFPGSEAIPTREANKPTRRNVETWKPPG